VDYRAAEGLDMVFVRPTTIRVAEDNRPEHVRVTPGDRPGTAVDEGLLRRLVQHMERLVAEPRQSIEEHIHFESPVEWTPTAMINKWRWERIIRPSGVRPQRTG
jgi:hypothetical protein